MHPVPFLCIFILLCFTSCMADNTKTVDELIGLQPHHNNSSAQLNKPEEEPTGRSRLDLALFLYKLSKSQNSIINQQEPPVVSDEELAKRRRETENQQTLEASRARKQGCKVFYWKSFTAC